MADHRTYQVRVLFSLDPDDPRECCGEEISVRGPGEDGWTLLSNIAHGPNPLLWCLDVVKARVAHVGQQLPKRMPFG